MPHSILSFDITSDKIYAELKIPLKELQFAVAFDVTQNTEFLEEPEGQQRLEDYFLAHIKVKSTNGHSWKVNLLDVAITEAEQTATGKYQELRLLLLMRPPKDASVRVFNLFYDAIVHQVVTHKIFVTIKQDWQAGKLDTLEKQIGVIELNIGDNSVPMLSVNLDEGSNWKGFSSMVRLGTHHIAEGIDHLLFLLVLLLPATLMKSHHHWTTFAGTRTSVVKILKIVTAFTFGHSLSLVLGAMHWVSLPSQPVEVFIALTVFLAAIHALRPIFFNREVYIAALFGLVHGLAFSSVLSDLRLETQEMFYSILGFNIGIEVMQVFIIFITIPWLIILSKNDHYKYIRIIGALFAIGASLAWMTERVTMKTNAVSSMVEQVFHHGKWLLLLLMCGAILSEILKRRISNSTA